MAVAAGLAALAHSSQHLHHDGLGGCAERLYCLIVTRLRQVLAIHLQHIQTNTGSGYRRDQEG